MDIIDSLLKTDNKNYSLYSLLTATNQKPHK